MGQGLPQAVHGVAVSAGGGVGGDIEDFRDAGEGEVFPDFQVDHGALFFRQAGQRVGDGKGRVRGGGWVGIVG